MQPMENVKPKNRRSKLQAEKSALDQKVLQRLNPKNDLVMKSSISLPDVENKCVLSRKEGSKRNACCLSLKPYNSEAFMQHPYLMQQWKTKSHVSALALRRLFLAAINPLSLQKHSQTFQEGNSSFGDNFKQKTEVMEIINKIVFWPGSTE